MRRRLPRHGARSHTSSCFPTPAFRCSPSSTTRLFVGTILTATHTGFTKLASTGWCEEWCTYSSTGSSTTISRWPPLKCTIPGISRSIFFLTSCFYLRVSGQFHFIVGMLYLFGFRLPETHHKYFLASSFTDFWRRINIYWKDFMLKVFYYPPLLAASVRNDRCARGLDDLRLPDDMVLHAYQWFWLRGTVLFVWQDILFWTIPGVLVVINSLYEVKHGESERSAKSLRTWRSVSTSRAEGGRDVFRDVRALVVLDNGVHFGLALAMVRSG